jgi:hypothetical protein
LTAVGVQTLDGLASGILAELIVIVIADLTKGTGRFNLVQGGIYRTIGIGATLIHLDDEKMDLCKGSNSEE